MSFFLFAGRVGVYYIILCWGVAPVKSGDGTGQSNCRPVDGVLVVERLIWTGQIHFIPPP